ncbi:cyclin-K-like, partial [Melanaphis sacchari]|uniref:cyclin-K-like n=1 Tax=Melanaphis sacchari TaxID=742174 RepID=UPI000DC14CDB
MSCWYFDKDELFRTPSARDGIPHEKETQYRQDGAKFIIDASTKLGLGYNTMATGVLTACCCLFLAGKVEETPKKSKDILNLAKTILPKHKYKTFRKDPKEDLLILEHKLLKTIKFDLQVDHPYRFITKYAKCFKGDQTKLTKTVQMAWTFIND